MLYGLFAYMFSRLHHEKYISCLLLGEYIIDSICVMVVDL